jgi:hypothetical protein
MDVTLQGGFRRTFAHRFLHLNQHVKLTEEDPALLVSGGHYSRAGNLDPIKLGNEHDVPVISVLPYSTQKMLSLDLSFKVACEKCYTLEMEHWIRRNYGKVVTVYQVVKFFGRAYLRTATAETAVIGVKERALPS